MFNEDVCKHTDRYKKFVSGYLAVLSVRSVLLKYAIRVYKVHSVAYVQLIFI